MTISADLALHQVGRAFMLFKNFIVCFICSKSIVGECKKALRAR